MRVHLKKEKKKTNFSASEQILVTDSGTQSGPLAWLLCIYVHV